MNKSMEILNSTKKVIGKKQTIRALSDNEVKIVFIAKDADPHVTSEIILLCQKKDVDVTYISNMKELGKACGIDVNAAAAAVLK